MSFIKNLKTAFGFSDNPISNDIDNDLAYDDTEKREPYINPFKSTPTEQVRLNVPQPPIVPALNDTTPTAKAPVISYELPEGFLTSIIGIVNANLPQIVKECIDIEAEKKAITQSLGSHFKSAIDDIHKAAQAAANASWEKERNEAAEQVKKATAEAAESARKADEAKQKCQVEESKRKALNERANTLEQRINTLEAEHEQYVIENKSLLNKIKVMQVYADDANTYKDLAEQNEKALAALRTEMEAKDREIEDSKRLANEAMHNATETSKAAADAAASAKAELDAANTANDNLKLELEITREEAAKGKASIEARDAEIDELKKELAEANTNLELMAEIERQLQHLEDFKAQKNNETKELKAQIVELQSHNESIAATSQNNAAENEKLKEELKTVKNEAEQNVMRVMQERDAAIKRLTMERAVALRQAADESAKALEEKEHLLDLKEDEKIRAIEAKESEINNIIATKNEEIEQIMHELSAEIEKVRNECRAIAKERDRIAGNLSAEQRDRKNDVAFYEQKIKFLTADQKRTESELRAEIQLLKDIQAQKDAQIAKEREKAAKEKEKAAKNEKKSKSKAEKEVEAPIDNDIADAVAQTFGFDSSINVVTESFDSAITGQNVKGSLDEPSEPKIPNDIFDNGTFSDDSIDATFDTSTDYTGNDTESEPTHTDEPSMDELGEIDWLMPTPPTVPEVKKLPEEEEESVQAKASEDAPQKPDAQMSLF